MDAKVKVTADKAGNVIIRSAKNPAYGYIRVEQTRMVLDDNGFARSQKISALILGAIEDLKNFGWSEGEEVNGKIIVKDSLTPFNKKNPEADLKIAGKSGITCMKDDQPIYKKHFYTMSSTAEDNIIAHTNGEEIVQAYALLKEEGVEEGTEEEKTDFTL